MSPGSAHQARLKKLRFRCSMSRRGDCYDNAVAESFFDTLKTECWDTAWTSHAEAHDAAALYIDGFYNLRRIHSVNDYVSPAEFERMAA